MKNLLVTVLVLGASYSYADFNLSAKEGSIRCKSNNGIRVRLSEDRKTISVRDNRDDGSGVKWSAAREVKSVETDGDTSIAYTSDDETMTLDLNDQGDTLTLRDAHELEDSAEVIPVTCK